MATLSIAKSSSDKWNAQKARQMVIDAFMGDYRKPQWLDSFYIVAGPYENDDPVAVAICRGEKANIVVLPCKSAVSGFWECHPNSQSVVIVIPEGFPSSEVRNKVFCSLGGSLPCLRDAK